MKGIVASINSGGVATGTSKKTILRVVAAAGVPLDLVEFSISGKGTSNSDQPLTVELVRQDDDGTLSSVTPSKAGLGDGTIQATAGKSASEEPTQEALLMSFAVHPQGGHFFWQARYDEEFTVPGEKAIAIVVTAAADVNVLAFMKFKELA